MFLYSFIHYIIIFFSCRYEWIHRGSTNIHGFIWLPIAPNFDKLDWNNQQSVENAIEYIDKYVSTWNPRTFESRNQVIHRSPMDDPCLKKTRDILTRNPLDDYTKLVNHVQ